MNLKKELVLIIGRIARYIRICEDQYSLYLAQKKSGSQFFYISQGTGGLSIGHPENLKMDNTSHFKSGSFIECQGGVKIGRYFHTGRGLTIFSSNHIYDNNNYIPYDEESELKEVVIEDFVWLGANVTIMPGVTIGEGAVIGGGSVVVKDIPKYAVAVGNPCRVIKYRNIELFNELKLKRRYL